MGHDVQPIKPPRTDYTDYSVAWQNGLGLDERIMYRRADPTGFEQPWDQAVALKRLARWRSQAPFSKDLMFDKKLKSRRIRMEEFLIVLGSSSPVSNSAYFNQPPWLAYVNRSFSQYEGETILDSIRVDQGNVNAIGFLTLIEPLVSYGREMLKQGLRAYRNSELSFDDTVEMLLTSSLANQLVRPLLRTMVLELNVARVTGVLEGSSAEERFKSFLVRLKQPSVALNLLQEYPLLARYVVQMIENWVIFSLEFIQHLCADSEELRKMFCPEGHLGSLLDISMGAGDNHRSGKAVVIVLFSSGIRIVYKPRPLAVDVHFGELLEWANARLTGPPFRPLRVLDHGTYGWTEFIKHESCGSIAEVERFYERQGGYLALLHCLDASDFHYENLIAAGEHPVLIDLETLFHPYLVNTTAMPSLAYALENLHHSVLRVGLLPQRLWSNGDNDGLDVSGLGGRPGQLTPFGVFRSINDGTDEMQFVQKRVHIPGQQNRPTLENAEVNMMSYQKNLLRGFESVYRMLMGHQEALLSPNGPIAAFKNDVVRVIVRPTQVYSHLLETSLHPNLLRCGLERDRLFDRLWAGVEHQPNLETLVPAEQEDLQLGDIPLFTSKPGSTSLWTSTGAVVENFTDFSGLEMSFRKLNTSSDEDLERQTWFINAALANMSSEAKHEGDKCRPLNLTSTKQRVTQDELFTAAESACARLEQLALQKDSWVSWIGLTPINERSSVISPMTSDLYSGLLGVALFLGYCGTVIKKEKYVSLARLALNSARDQYYRVERAKGGPGIGVFTGDAGLLYVLTHLGSVWKEPLLLEEAESLVAIVRAGIDNDRNLDIIGGLAGCICVLTGLYRCTASNPALSAAILCGERLISLAITMPTGAAWLTAIAPHVPLTGFSHGAAGISFALLELYEVTGDVRFRESAFKAIFYERSQLERNQGNWLDLRTSPDHAGKVAWCHGAPGIGLARLAHQNHIADSDTQDEIQIAIKSTLQYGFGRSHCLCHGDLGNIEVLLQARLTLGPQWNQLLEQVTGSILQSINDHGFLCGGALYVETPGLMTGVAGIGYGLLRLAAPSCVPSLLLLAPPLAA